MNFIVHKERKMQFGVMLQALQKAVAENPDWRWYPVQMCDINVHVRDVSAVRVYLATRAFNDGSVVDPDNLIAPDDETTLLSTPVVVVELK